MENQPFEEFKVLITEDEMAELEEIGHPIHRTMGQPFFLEGEPGDFALLIKKGHVKVTSGQPPRIIDIRGPGAVVGELAVISGEPRMASIIAFNDVEALRLPGPAWLQFLLNHPRACLALAIEGRGMISRAVQKTVESELAIEQQLAKRLIDLVDLGLGETTGEGAVVFRQISQSEMASQVGARKIDSVKKVIGLLRAAGILATGRQEITVLQVDALREIDPALGLLELYDDALPHVYGYLLARCGDAGLAEDLTAESFLAAVQAVRQPGAADPSVPWLIGVARHKLADHWRRVEREQRGLRLLDGEPPCVDDPWETAVDRIRAREVLGRLGAHHRAALTLRYLDGLPVPEVARHLDRTVHATEALLVRARAAFRRIYEGEEGSR
jgi:RNA polymerase sigma factor (sigma-70 family)